MAKKDKPTKEKSKTKQDAGAAGGKVSKKKSDKLAAVASKKSDKLAAAAPVEEQQPDQPGGASGEPATEGKGGSFSSGQLAPNDGTAARTSKTLSPPEWNSESVRNASLIKDGFSCCIVLVMEDSPDLSKYGEFLLRAVETGVRRKFQCISGAQTAERVKRFLANTGQAVDDQSLMERQDLFAEAIKCTLLGIKETVATEIDADHLTKEMELAGARSKDLIRYVPPLTIPVGGGTGGTSGTPGGGGGDADGIREPPPAPPPTEQGLSQLATPSPPSKKMGKNKAAVEETPSAADTSKPSGTVSLATTKVGVKTRMRKRGEVPMPEFEVIDDSPPKGPRSYILLQGFYNPGVIDELRKIGVKVDGILLMTDAKVDRYNFSIIDVEDSIPGTFKPRNVLPQYLKTMERLSQNPETRNSEVTQFWSKLSEMYNSASTDSPFHDIALMNFPLPDSKRINLESTDGITYYISKVYDEVAKRVYEMLVLEEWFHEFNSAADVTKLQPLEPALPHDVYDQIVSQIPTECISVPILLEAIVQQVAHSLEEKAGNPVPEPCYDEDTTAGIITGKSSFGSTNWGMPANKNGENDSENKNAKAQKPGESDKIKRSLSSLFKVPMYIKAGDYASIRNCHLNETLASKIASCQLSGDMRNIRGFLWQKIPEFNRGLYMKLLGNLNHFLYFMPPDMIQFEDMFYILHLLMSAGVEVHLQKAAEGSRKSTDSNKRSSIIYNDGVYYQNRPQDTKFPGTNLSTDHNYLAVSQKTGLHFVISPNSSHELTVASFGHSQDKPDSATKGVDSKNILETFLNAAQKQPSDTEDPSEVANTKKLKKKKSRPKKQVDQTLDVNKAARVTTVGAIQSAVKYARDQTVNADKSEAEILDKRKNKNKSKGKKGKGKGDEGMADESKSLKEPEGDAAKTNEKLPNGQTTEDGGENAEIDSKSQAVLGDGAPEKKQGFANMNYPSEETKRFIACEEQWFENINDTSVIQALLECPALLAINESGALDLSKWIEKYLLSAGMDVGPGEGVLLGDLKNWNFVEELVPIQTVQMLNQASQEYLSMQRMYCPFYDTILFIFNNPTPKELTTECQFYFRLKTLPGLQHFLEYTMDDKSVLRWIEQLDAGKRLEVGEQTSINTLLNIIPEEQWLMVPSIKYQIMVENQRSMSRALSNGSIQKGAFYGQISSYNKLGSPEVSSGSTKSFVPGSPGVNGSPSGTLEGSNETEMAATAQDTTNAAVTETGVNENDSPKSAVTSSKALSTKGSTKTKSEGGNKLDKKGATTSHTSADAALASGSGKLDPVDSAATAAQNSPDSAFGDMDKSPFEDKDGLRIPKELELLKSSLNFACYDLGKRVAVVGNDTFFLFPMDGTVIRYDISTIEPEFRMMQLTVSKNGHQTFFYPYYIPHDFDLSSEEYVVCPYFHMVLANGTIFAFQDIRAEEAAPYLKIAMNKRNQDKLFSFEKVLFGQEVEKKLNEVATSAAAEKEAEERGGSAESHGSEGKLSGGGKKKSLSATGSGRLDGENREGGGEKADAEGKNLDESNSQTKKNKKGLKEKRSKKLHDKSPEPETKKEKKEKEKKGKKEKEKKGKANKAEVEAEEEEDTEAGQGGATTVASTTSPGETGDEAGYASKDGETALSTAEELEAPAPPPSSEAEDGLIGAAGAGGGEWMYPSSENSDDEAETQKRRLFFAPPWDDAVQLIKPMMHAFTTTLPSGLVATVEDVSGPPLLRTVKQHYVGHGSARSTIEGSRYYTMDGSVIKFLLDGSIQVLTARGVTTTIDELAANSKRDTENASSAFGSASIVKIFNGEVILPNGHMWQVVNGKKVVKTPIYVFTTGPLAGGEVFRRRQDGVVYLHRYDGTVITHYPDGTRFTTRMVILEKNTPPAAPTPRTSLDPNANTSNPDTSTPKEPAEKLEKEDDEFSDWVFVGLKYMIEHPNYSTVLFNTLSGNVHLKLPHGEWVRVFADGNIRISTEDQYCLDVDKTRALLSYPPCSKGTQALPNLTSVRLWHEAPPGRQQDLQPDTLQIPVPAEEAALSPAQPITEQRTSQVQLELPTLDVEKASEHTPVKKKSKNLHHAKNLHPKVKQREGKVKRATRLGSMLAGTTPTGGKKSGASEGPTKVDIPPAEDTAKKSDEGIEEGKRDDALPEIILPKPEPEPPRPSLRVEGDALSDFLMFKDETSFCKAVDSWDNRFLMDVYGGAVVDKMEKEDSSKDMNTQQLIDTLSEHSQLPKEYISGILRNTSSENLETAARRLQAIRKGYNESCSGGLPNTKIFVVKRDLSAFQYLQKSQVEDEITKAYGSRESMVIVDPVPKRKPRKFVTIMRPVEEVDEPHGMWTRPYIEPMFRPRGVTNKHLSIATPNDLRWFGYILKAAHVKRPKFVPEPKEVYKEKKEIMRMERNSSVLPEEQQTRRSTKIKSMDGSQGVKSPIRSPMRSPLRSPLSQGPAASDIGGPPGDDVGEPIGESAEEGYSGEGEEEEGTSGEEEQGGKRESQVPPRGSAVDDDKKKKSKKDKKEKEKEAKEGGKKGKGKDKKGKAVKEAILNTSDEEEEGEEEEAIEEILSHKEGSQVEVDPLTGEPIGRHSKSSHRSAGRLDLEPEIEEYPPEIDDIKGIYEMDRERRASNLPKIIAKEHSIPCNTKKAVVVRAFVEIPKVDENMQRALLAASMSYAETCKTEAAIFKTYKTEDPRSAEEKQKQTQYKQQMIEQNIDEMHLLEQKPGPVLRFHF